MAKLGGSLEMPMGLICQQKWSRETVDEATWSFLWLFGLLNSSVQHRALIRVD